VKVHAALASAYPDEAAVRADNTDNLGTYHGIWTHPYGDRPLVHVFADCDQAELEAAGWTREDA
jgi:hypothetical protein